MAQEIVFWKLHSNKSNNLIDFLDSIKKPLIGYSDDWNDISNIKYDNPEYYSQIYQRIKNDIKNIADDDFYLITSYFFIQFFKGKRSSSIDSINEKKYYDELKEIGIEFIAEIDGKSPSQEFIHTLNNSEYYLQNEHLITGGCRRNGCSTEIIKNLKFVNYFAGIITLQDYYDRGSIPENDYQMTLLELEMEELSTDPDLKIIFDQDGNLKFPFEEMHDFVCNEWISYVTTKNVIESIKAHKGNVIIEDTNC